MVQAQRYTARRLALVGDAAHAIHPIAGQGWNLALRDVAALAELVIDARRLGLDPGGAAVLARYERWRRFDSLALIAITDGLNRLFGNDLLPLRLARELGLGLVERDRAAQAASSCATPWACSATCRALMRGEALLSRQAQRTQAMRRRLVEPGVPNGTPAVITRLEPGSGDAALERVVAGALDHLVDVVGVLADHARAGPRPARGGAPCRAG